MGKTILDEMGKMEASGMAPWQVPQDLYLAPGGTNYKIEVKDAFETAANRIETLLGSLAGTARRSWTLSSNPDLHLHESSERDMWCDTPNLFVTDPAGQPIAAFIGGDTFVKPAWRKRGIAAELVLARAVLHDEGVRTGYLYTPGGYRAAVASHLLAVEHALKEGRNIPTNVLRDYPELEERRKSHQDDDQDKPVCMNL